LLDGAREYAKSRRGRFPRRRLQRPPAELPILLAPIIEGRADITLGSRLGGKSNPGALPWHQSFGNRVAAGLIRLLYGVKVSDLGPFRAGRAEVLRSLALEETTYGWAVEMIVKGAIAGFRIVEVPVSYHPRIGKSKISGTVKGTIGAGWFILSRIVLYSFRRRRAERRDRRKSRWTNLPWNPQARLLCGFLARTAR